MTIIPFKWNWDGERPCLLISDINDGYIACRKIGHFLAIQMKML